jgi:hypothetical protein
MMFWNNWLAFFCESYLFLGVCVALNTWYLLFNTFGNAFNSTITVVLGSILLLLPVFVSIFYNQKRYFKSILTRDEEFFARYGSIVESLNFHRKGKIVTIYPVVSMIRKIWLILTVVYMQEQPTFSIFAVNFQSQIMLMVVGLISPFATRTANNMELMNESFILLTNYHLFIFTAFVQDITAQELVGHSLIVVTCTNVGLNFGLVTLQNLALLSRKIKLLFLEWRQA